MLQLKTIGNGGWAFISLFTDLKMQFDQKHPYEVNSVKIKIWWGDFQNAFREWRSGIHLVHPLEKLLVREETKKQRMWPECQRRVNRNVLPQTVDTRAVPGLLLSSQRAVIKTRRSWLIISFVGNCQMLQLQTWLQSRYKPDHLTQQSLIWLVFWVVSPSRKYTWDLPPALSQIFSELTYKQKKNLD